MPVRLSTVRTLGLCALLVGAATAVGMTALDLRSSMTAGGLPYPHAERLVTVAAASKSWSPGMLEVAKAHPAFDRLAGIQERAATLQLDQRAEIIRLESVSWTYFDLLGIQAHEGRVLTSVDDRRNVPTPVAVISHRLWQTRLNGRTDVLGQPLRVDGRTLEIVGVLAPGTRGLIGRTDIWTPLGSARWLSGDTGPERPTSRWFEVFGRVRADLTLDAAAAQFAAEFPAALSAAGLPSDLVGNPPRVRLSPLSDTRVSTESRRAAPALYGAAVVLAMFVVVTMSSVLLLVQRRRQRDFAVQLALGAEPRHFIWPAVRDGVVIATAGIGLGLLVRPALIGILAAIRPPATAFGIVTAHWLTPSDPLAPTAALVFAATLLVCCAITVSIAVAVVGRARTKSLGSPTAVEGFARRGTPAAWLLSLQIALACAVLAGAMLMTTAVLSVLESNRGYDWRGVFTARLSLPDDYDRNRAHAFYTRLVERLMSEPGIAGVSISTCAPGAGRCRQSNITGIDGVRLSHPPQIGVHIVSPNHFDVIGASMVRGRALGATDTSGAPLAVVITSRLAARFWPTSDPLGRQLEIYTANGSLDGLRTVVGVVENIRFNVDEDAGLDVFLPLGQAPPALSTMVFMKGTAAGRTGVAALEREVAGLDRRVPVYDAAPLEQHLTDSLATERLLANVLRGFAAVTVILAVLGTYAMTSQAAASGRRELAVRQALGATPGHVGRLIGRSAALIATVGVGAGMAITLAGTRLLSSMLHGTPEHHVSLFIAPVVVAFAVGVATLLPIRQALRVSLAESMRET
jgi:putative ABC transport system permease protein